MAMITTEAMGESAPSNTPGTCHFEARNAINAPDKPVAMSPELKLKHTPPSEDPPIPELL